ncbi:hypothetical protein ACLB2K_038480 [Fragaria x ananassa]
MPRLRLTRTIRAASFSFGRRARGGASSSSSGCSSLILGRRLDHDITRPDAVDGFNDTIITYGQTGAGKTYGMEGPSIMAINEQERGLVPRVVDLIA